METLKINCPSCDHVTTVDAAKVPDKPVRVSCPSCGNKTVIDKRKLLEGAGQPQTDAAPSAPSAPAAPRRPRPVQSAPAPASQPTTDASPAVNTIPSGIVVGDDDGVVDELARALAPFQCTLDRVAQDGLRSRFAQAIPELIIFVADEVGGPPYAPLQPIGLLTPAERRETFVVLAGGNLRTMDGSAAFFYNVNMVLSRNDFSRAGQAIASGLGHHRHLYRHLMQPGGS